MSGDVISGTTHAQQCLSGAFAQSFHRLEQQIRTFSDDAQRVLGTFLNTDGIELMQHIEAFEEDLKGVACERIVERDTLVRHGEATIQSVRAQIEFEESATLPWARTRLDERAWTRLDGDINVTTHQWCGSAWAGAA